jgi:hypothetical protein
MVKYLFDLRDFNPLKIHVGVTIGFLVLNIGGHTTLGTMGCSGDQVTEDCEYP